MDGISYKKWMDRIGRVLVSVIIAVLLTMLFLAVFAFAMLKGSLSASVRKDWPDCNERYCLLCRWIFLRKEKYEEKVFMGTGGWCFILFVFFSDTCGNGAAFYGR